MSTCMYSMYMEYQLYDLLLSSVTDPYIVYPMVDKFDEWDFKKRDKLTCRFIILFVELSLEL